VEADTDADKEAEAEDYQYNYPELRPQVPRLPSNAAQLHVRDITISTHYRTEIEKAAPAQETSTNIFGQKITGWKNK
jgi:hypothetical protein